MLVTDTPDEYYKLGYRDPTDAEIDHAAGVEQYGSFEQQAQAQGERVLRGLTFGAVEGFGSPEDIQGRADVSREESPIASFAADVLPDVGVAAVTGGLGGLATGAGRAAGRAALAEGGGLIRAGLAAGRAGGAAALAGESIGTGLVGAGQSAFAEGRDFEDDPGKFAEDALIWGGLNFGLGSILGHGAPRAADEVIDGAGESLDDIAKTAEFRAPKETSAVIDEAPAITPDRIVDVGAAEPPSIAGMSGQELGADAFRPGELERLRNDQTFAETGMPEAGIGRTSQGDAILLRQRSPDGTGPLKGEGMFLVDGSHRVQVAREKGLESLPGVLLDAQGEEIYRGPIRIGKDSATELKAAGYGGIDDFEPGELDNALKPLFPTATAEDFRNLVGGNVVATPYKPGISVGRSGDVTIMSQLEGGGTISRRFFTDEQGRKTAEHLQLYLEGNRGKGLGKQMLDKAIETYRKEGFDRIVLNAEGGSDKIWKRYGFEPIGNGTRMEMSLEPPTPPAAVRIGKTEAVEGGVERALRNASKSDADDLVEQAVRAPVPEQEANSFGRQRRLYINRKAINEVATREMQQDLSKVVKDVEQITRADKLASIATNVSDNLGAQRSVARSIAEDAAKFAGELRAEARAYGAASGKKGLQYAIPGQKGWTMALMDHAKEIEQATDGRALFEALDGFKRTAQDYKLSLESGALNSANPIHHQQLIPKIEAFASKIRSALEDAGTWGKAGDMQRAYNAVISDRLMPSWRIFEEETLKRTHKGYDGMWNVEGWESKLSSLLENSDPGARRHVGAVLDAMDELGSVRRQFGDAKTAARIQDGVAKVRRTIGLADEVADATERMKALGEIVGGVPYGGAIAGGLAGGFPGAAIGAALPGAVRGFVMGDLISAFQRLSGATDAAVARGVDDWIRSSRVRGSGVRGLAGKLPKLSGEAKQLADVAARRGVSHGMALFMGEDQSPASAFARIRDALLDDDKFFQSLSDDYGTLQQESPDVYMALAGRASIARQFLIQRMPPNIAVSMANPNGYPPNRDAIEDWAVYVNAVRYPTRIAKSPGSMSVQEAETLRVVHPRMHELIQQQTIVSLARAQAAGEKLDDTLLARVNLLFPDVDGAGSPVFSKEFGDAVRSYNAMQKQKPGGSTAPMKPRELTTPTQLTMQGGATYGTAG